MAKRVIQVTGVQYDDKGQVSKVTVGQPAKPSRSAMRSASGRDGDFVTETLGDRVRDAAIGAAGKAAGSLFKKLTGGK